MPKFNNIKGKIVAKGILASDPHKYMSIKRDLSDMNVSLEPADSPGSEYINLVVENEKSSGVSQAIKITNLGNDKKYYLVGNNDGRLIVKTMKPTGTTREALFSQQPALYQASSDDNTGYTFFSDAHKGGGYIVHKAYDVFVENKRVDVTKLEPNDMFRRDTSWTIE